MSLFADFSVQQAMLDGLRFAIREKLRQIIMEDISPLVEEAIETALADLEVALQTVVNQQTRSEIVHVLLTDKRENKNRDLTNTEQRKKL